MTSLLSSGLRNSFALMITVGLFAIMISLVPRPPIVNTSSPQALRVTLPWSKMAAVTPCFGVHQSKLHKNLNTHRIELMALPSQATACKNYSRIKLNNYSSVSL